MTQLCRSTRVKLVKASDLLEAKSFHNNTSMAFLQLFSLLQLFVALALATPIFLNLTAISASNGHSTLECWQLTDPFAVSNTPGTTGTAIQQLGNASNASFTILPPKFDGGAHRAPAVQWVSKTTLLHVKVLRLLQFLSSDMSSSSRASLT